MDSLREMGMNLRLFIVVIACMLLGACGSTYPAPVVRLQLKDSVKPAWMVRLPESIKGEFSSIAFTPDGKRVLLGGENGQAVLWRIGDAAPERVFSGEADPLGSVAVSSTGTDFYTVEYAPLDHMESPFVIRRRSLIDGKVQATGRGKGHCSRMVVDPTGRFVAVSSSFSFYLFDADTLALVVEDYRPVSWQQDFQSSVQPPIFVSSTQSEVEVMALARRWKVSNGKATMIGEVPSQPAALGPAPGQGFYPRNVSINEQNLITYLLWIPHTEGGVVVASLDNQNKTAYLVADRHSSFGAITFIPRGAPPGGYLVVEKNDELCLYDLVSGTYRYLMRGRVPQNIGFSVSLDSQQIAYCGTRTIAVWNIP